MSRKISKSSKDKINKQIDKALLAEKIAQRECDKVSVLLADNGYSHYIAQRFGGDGILFVIDGFECEEYYNLEDLVPDDEWVD